MEFYSPDRQVVVGSFVMLPQKGSTTGKTKRPLNSYAVLRDGYSVLIDAPFEWTLEGVRALQAEGFPPKAHVLTHADVATAANALEQFDDEFDAPTLLHRLDKELPKVAELDFEFQDVEQAGILADARLRLIQMPGHTPGSVMLHSEEEGGVLVTGDSAVAPGPEQSETPPLLERPPLDDATEEAFRNRWVTLAEELTISAVLPLHGRPFVMADMDDDVFDAAVRNIWKGEPMSA